VALRKGHVLGREDDSHAATLVAASDSDHRGFP
jgi:hypothetical protein